MREPISSKENFCTGIISEPNEKYITGVMLSVGKAKRRYEHHGSKTLDYISAFDKAEAADIYVGQTNIVYVSSFCSPDCYLWGYNLARVDNLNEPHSLLGPIEGDFEGRNFNIFSAAPIIDAFRKLIGTSRNRRFTFYPGTILPAAGKSIELLGPANIYAAIGVGITHDNLSAHTFMEDIGSIPLLIEGPEIEKYKSKILKDIAHSVIGIGNEQGINFDTVFVEIVNVEIGKDEVGSSLVLAPYFNIAKRAVQGGNFNDLKKMSLQHWEKNTLINLR